MSEWFHIIVKTLDILVAIKTWSYFRQIWQKVLLNNIAYPAFKYMSELKRLYFNLKGSVVSTSSFTSFLKHEYLYLSEGSVYCTISA